MGGHREAYDLYSGPPAPAANEAPRPEAPGPKAPEPEAPEAGARQALVDLTTDAPPPPTEADTPSWPSGDAAVVVTAAGPYTAVFVRALEDFGGLETKQAQMIFTQVRSSGRALISGLTPERASRLVQELSRIEGQAEPHGEAPVVATPTGSGLISERGSARS